MTVRNRKRRARQAITPDKFLTAEQEAKCFEYMQKCCTSPRGKTTQLMFAILVNCGLRAEELCDLKVCDTPEYLGEPVLVVFGKGSKYRNVPVAGDLVREIREYVAGTRTEFVNTRRMKKSDPEQYLFLTERGKKYRRQMLYQRIVRVGRGARIPKRLKPHMLRHTFATKCVRAGVPLPVLQRLLGHSSIETTAIYAGVEFGEIQRAVERVYTPLKSGPKTEQNAGQVFQNIEQIES